jgi:hypothetical protein
LILEPFPEHVRDNTETGGEGGDGPSPTLVAAGAVLVAVVVVLVGALVVGGETGASLAMGAMTILFVAVGLGLFRIARKVGSEADDPAEVERRMAEGLGMSEERTQLRVDRVEGEEETVPSQRALDERFYEDEPE